MDDTNTKDPNKQSHNNRNKTPLFERLVGQSNESSVIFNGTPAQALVDSGSMITSVSENFYEKMDPKPVLHQLNELNISLKGAGGDDIPYKGYLEVEIEIPHISAEKFYVPVLVVNNTNYNLKVPVVIGTNVIKMLQCVNHDSLPDEWKTALYTIKADTSLGIVKSTNKNNIQIQPNQTVTLSGFVRKTSDHKTAVTEPSTVISSRIGVCPRIVNLDQPGKSARVPVKIFNMSAKAITILPNTPICELQEAKVLRAWEPETTNANKQQETDSVEKDNFLDKINVKLDHLDSETSQKMKNLFWKWKDIFSLHSLDIGNTDLVKHKINLNVPEPFKEPYRRIPPGPNEEVREHVNEMLAMGAIRPSKSPFSSNVVIVRKKDGTIRFCLDYRKLNTRTHKDAYALPRVDDTLHLLAGARLFSKIDLKAGYWQVEMEERDKEKTAFQVGNLGFYECNRMPFGLCNAPATFQRLMERCMGEMNLKHCLIYLDDVIIFSSTVDEHIERLEAVFRQLKLHNLKLKASKCEFLLKEVSYLGHIVSEDGIKADPAKIEAVKNWPTPTSIKDVRSFLGFAGYYRKFIANFASIVRPLNDLLIGTTGKDSKPKSKTSKFKWESEQQEAFETIKTKLTSAPVLAYADYSKPFKLFTDASSLGLGAVLYQEYDGLDRVVAYASRSLKSSERNYHSSKLEFLALKWAITDKFHDYLYGIHFDVFTDNNPLTYVQSSAKLNACGHRWVASLANYNFDIHYQPGKSNVVADALSRLPKPEGTEIETETETQDVEQDVIQAVLGLHTVTTTDTIVTDVPGQDRPIHDTEPEPAAVLKDKDWITGQDSDPVIHKVRNYVATGTSPSSLDLKKETPEIRKYMKQFDRLYLENGILKHKSFISEEQVAQIVLPESARFTIFKALHYDLGHQGRDRTLSLFKERFYWPSLNADVVKWVQQCDRCIRRKTSPVTRAELVDITSSQPMELVCINFLSLEVSKGGYENVLVITDHFTRYAQAIPTKNQTARTTARALFDNFFVHYGFPQKLHSDRGQNFLSKVIQRLCRITGIKRTRTTSYHPQGNGQCERYNQTLLQMLGTLPNKRKSDWKSAIPSLVNAYNATIHPATGLFPHHLMFGRKPRLAIDAVLGLKHQKISGTSPSEYMKHLEVNLKETYKLADIWSEDVFKIVEQPDPNIPVFRIQKEDNTGNLKTLHRNNLLPISHLPMPINSESDTVSEQSDSTVPLQPEYESCLSSSGTTSRDTDSSRKSSSAYIPPHRRKPGEPGLFPRRSKRISRKPEWLMRGDYVL